MTRWQLGVSDGCLREMCHPTDVRVTHENFQAETALKTGNIMKKWCLTFRGEKNGEGLCS